MFFLRSVTFVAKRTWWRLWSLLLALFGNSTSPEASAALLVVICLINTFTGVSNMEYPKVYTPIDMKHYLANRSPLIEQSFIPWPLLGDSNVFSKQYKQLSMEYDPRLLPALWIKSIVSSLDETSFDSGLKLPFRWVSALDLQPGLRYKDIGSVGSCSEFQEALGIKKSEGVCEQVAQTSPDLPKYSIVGPTDEPLSEFARRYVGANYLLYNLHLPRRIVLLGVGPGENDRSSVVVPIDGEDEGPAFEKSDLEVLAGHVKDSDVKWVSLKEQASRLKSRWSCLNVPRLDDEDPQYESFRFVKRALPEELDITEFQNQPLVFSDDLDGQLTSNIQSVNEEEKYFHEARILGSSKGSHYDWRFFKKTTYSPYERTAVLHRLTKAWLRFANDAGLRTWLAHGTLLGWYWNGLNMPWDDDLDVQMSMKSLHSLARNYNQSIVVDLNDEEPTGHMYFVDVNPNFYKREKGNGANVIDARFIDVSSGLYVDITGLGVSDDIENVQNSPGTRQNSHLHRIFNPEYEEASKSFKDAPGLQESVELELRNMEIEQWNAGRLYNCKDDHFFLHEELKPEKAWFEGVEAYVPTEYMKILKREYSRGTRAKQHKGWRFSQAFGLWIPISECGKAALGCDKEEWILEEEYTRHIRQTPRNRNPPTAGPSKVDPWLIQHNQQLLKITN
ncbi:hypothetical protein FT663_01275 [Candidozyma haemuli var. vulneris]|uniref:LicD/FKTN/FKRP nucleotidyltransferase domain-containing protein n=1 Tax=Candidozyma haemuli TaxID=45357 RepID=A0A2V1AX57_9ASCO|nr:hypothetical protein CXQ85_004952 [[Candida] haemuloni]KAF3992140.1 hypothetical protein FT662_01310 [[Candida] haemuloni var. vulneris]KAF3994585.1 hypothetical protein FT663_01275 [[Candida] haemuloni var. vulneris]PVH22384.1 hypothetical protein CXQ85_004952 [[Candida] haemuloni]